MEEVAIYNSNETRTFPRADPSCMIELVLEEVAVPSIDVTGVAVPLVLVSTTFENCAGRPLRITESGTGVNFSAREATFGRLTCAPASGTLQESVQTVRTGNCWHLSLWH